MTNFPKVGVGVIIEVAGKVLLIKRINAHGAGTWSTPGGHLDFGETPEACAVRETEEETNLKIQNVRFRGITNDIFEPEGVHYITIWMGGEPMSGEPRVNAPDEASEVGWFSWDDLPEPLFLPLENMLAGKGYISVG
jgi:8-oxo-dGTP diphosphatase